MKIEKIKHNISLSLAIGFIGVMALIVPNITQAATCDITRDLQMGVTGDDVLCLQKYLNGNGYVIAQTGAGAPGKETGEYKTLTQAAVIAWQKANNISPASGYFGPRSRAVFQSVSSGAIVPVTTGGTATTNGNALVDQLLAQVKALQAKAEPVTKPVTVVDKEEDEAIESDSEEGEMRDLMSDILDAFKEIEDAIEDSEDAAAKGEADDLMESAKEDLFDGLRAYLDRDYDKASKRLTSSFKWTEKSLDEVGGNSAKSDAKDILDEVENKLDEVEEEIDLANEDGEDTDESEDLLDEARDLFDEAEEMYDDGDYDEAEDLADEANDLLGEAEDAIGESGNGVEDDLDDARDELDDARDDVDNAIDDGEDVGDAEDMLDEAEDLLDDAETALDDDDEDEAEDLIDEALDLIDDALGEW
jgi:peptidoglycan hydrolase-like protein with peptidoglycan-binding domain